MIPSCRAICQAIYLRSVSRGHTLFIMRVVFLIAAVLAVGACSADDLPSSVDFQYTPQPWSDSGPRCELGAAGITMTPTSNGFSAFDSDAPVLAHPADEIGGDSPMPCSAVDSMADTYAIDCDAQWSPRFVFAADFGGGTLTLTSLNCSQTFDITDIVTAY